MTVLPAPVELVDLVAAMRPDWPRPVIEGHVCACALAGWSWTRTVLVTVSAALDDAARASCLRERREPWAHATPGDYAQGVAQARHALRAEPQDDEEPRD